MSVWVRVNLIFELNAARPVLVKSADDGRGLPQPKQEAAQAGRAEKKGAP